MSQQQQELPPDWALERAIGLRQEENTTWAIGVTAANLKHSPRLYPSVIAFARFIAEHEKPPVSAKLLAARSHMSSQFDYRFTSDRILRGERDESGVIRAFVAGWDARSSRGRDD